MGPDGTIFLSDTHNHCVRCIRPDKSLMEDALLVGTTGLRESVAKNILDNAHLARLKLSEKETKCVGEIQKNDFVTLETLKVVNQVLQRAAQGNTEERLGLRQLLAGAQLKMRRRDCEVKEEVCVCVCVMMLCGLKSSDYKHD